MANQEKAKFEERKKYFLYDEHIYTSNGKNYSGYLYTVIKINKINRSKNSVEGEILGRNPRYNAEFQAAIVETATSEEITVNGDFFVAENILTADIEEKISKNVPLYPTKYEIETFESDIAEKPEKSSVEKKVEVDTSAENTTYRPGDCVVDYISPSAYNCFYSSKNLYDNDNSPAEKVFSVNSTCQIDELQKISVGKIKGANSGLHYFGGELKIVKLSSSFATLATKDNFEFRCKIRKHYGKNEYNFFEIDCWEGDPILDGCQKGYICLTPNDFKNVETIDAVKIEIQEIEKNLKEVQKMNADLTGKTAKVITDDEKEFDVQYSIVEVNELIASHLVNGNDISKNPSYPAELQPRDRENRVAMHLKTLEMVNNIRPDDLMASRNLNQGAPVVNSENIVLNGNGRVMALTVAYDKGKAEHYRAELIKRAAEFGFNTNVTSRFVRPVLIRKISTPLAESDIKSIIQATAGGAKLGASEQAKIDATNIKYATFSHYVENDNGDLTTGENASFVAQILQDITNSNDINAYICNDGKISIDGINRAKRALLATAYSDTGLLARMTESTEDNIKTISNALVNIAPSIAILNHLISKGAAYPYELAQNISAAANKLSCLREEKTTVKDYLAAQSLFADMDYSAESKAILAIFDANKRSAKNITAIFKNVIQTITAQGSPNQTTLFADIKPLDLLSILDKASKNFDCDAMDNLFDDKTAQNLNLQQFNADNAAKDETNNAACVKIPPVNAESNINLDDYFVNPAALDVATQAEIDNAAEIETAEIETVETPNADNAAEIETPATAEIETVKTLNAVDSIKSKIEMVKDKINLTFNGVSLPAMFENLQKRGLNFETSYLILLNAVIFGEVKISSVKRTGKKAEKWNNASTKANYTAHSQYWARRNLNGVARSVNSKNILTARDNFIKIADIDKKAVNGILRNVFADNPQTDLQQFTTTPAPESNINLDDYFVNPVAIDFATQAEIDNAATADIETVETPNAVDFVSLVNFVIDSLPVIFAGNVKKFVDDTAANFALTEDLINQIDKILEYVENKIKNSPTTPNGDAPTPPPASDTTSNNDTEKNISATAPVIPAGDAQKINAACTENDKTINSTVNDNLIGLTLNESSKDYVSPVAIFDELQIGNELFEHHFYNLNHDAEKYQSERAARYDAAKNALENGLPIREIKVTKEMIGLTFSGEDKNKGYYYCNFKALQIGKKFFPAKKIYVGASDRNAQYEIDARQDAAKKAIVKGLIITSDITPAEVFTADTVCNSAELKNFYFGNAKKLNGIKVDGSLTIVKRNKNQLTLRTIDGKEITLNVKATPDGEFITLKGYTLGNIWETGTKTIMLKPGDFIKIQQPTKETENGEVVLNSSVDNSKVETPATDNTADIETVETSDVPTTISKFEVGKEYFSEICIDGETYKHYYLIIERTEKSLVFEDNHGTTRRAKIHTGKNSEWFKADKYLTCDACRIVSANDGENSDTCEAPKETEEIIAKALVNAYNILVTIFFGLSVLLNATKIIKAYSKTLASLIDTATIIDLPTLKDHLILLFEICTAPKPADLIQIAMLILQIFGTPDNNNNPPTPPVTPQDAPKTPANTNLPNNNFEDVTDDFNATDAKNNNPATFQFSVDKFSVKASETPDDNSVEIVEVEDDDAPNDFERGELGGSEQFYPTPPELAKKLFRLANPKDTTEHYDEEISKLESTIEDYKTEYLFLKTLDTADYNQQQQIQRRANMDRYLNKIQNSRAQLEFLRKVAYGVTYDINPPILEPSAGNGDLINACIKTFTYNNGIDSKISKLHFDTIEIDAGRAATLKENGYKVIWDNFLTFNPLTPYHTIILNPPFKSGVHHLKHAIDICAPDGQIFCILNAETIKNPFSRTRQKLIKRLETGAEYKIEFVQDAFKDQGVNVEVALIYYRKQPDKNNSVTFDNFKKIFSDIYNAEGVNLGDNAADSTELTNFDTITAMINKYRAEVKATIALYNEAKKFNASIKNNPLIDPKILKIDFQIETYADNAWDFIKKINKKYWTELLYSDELANLLTTDSRQNYINKIDEMAKFEFNERNIFALKEDLKSSFNGVIDAAIMKLWELFTHKFSMENPENIHYYNGWKHNKAFKCNNKVIIPLYDPAVTGDYWRHDKFSDICRDIAVTMNYINGGTNPNASVEHFFKVQSYKKGTTHFTFKFPELLKKFNLYCGKRFNWLPDDYGKKAYSDLTPEEKALANEFEGQDSYNDTYKNRNFYLTIAAPQLPALNAPNTDDATK